MYKLYTSFLNFISKHFFPFWWYCKWYCFLNNSVFLTSFLDCSLLACINTIGFYILILCPETWLNSLINSNRFLLFLVDLDPLCTMLPIPPSPEFYLLLSSFSFSNMPGSLLSQDLGTCHSLCLDLTFLLHFPWAAAPSSVYIQSFFKPS